MSLAGSAVIAIWQDVDPEAREDYLRWHTEQHVAERLGIPGFLRARRYVSVEGGPEFYTLYETATADVASGKDYQDRLNAPTEWTRRIMPSFRNMARSVCRTQYSENTTQSDLLLTIRLDIAQDIEQDITGMERNLKALIAEPGVTGLHLCVADDSASKVASFEKTFRAAPDLVPPCVVMMEGLSEDQLRRVRDMFLNATGAAGDSAMYTLQLSRWSAQALTGQSAIAVPS